MRPDFQSASFSHTLVPCSFRNKDQNRLKMFSWNVLFLFLLHNSVLSGCSSFYVCCLSFWWMNCWFWLFCKLALYLNFMYNDFDCLPNHLLLPSVATFYIKTMSPSSCYTWRPKTVTFFFASTYQFLPLWNRYLLHRVLRFSFTTNYAVACGSQCTCVRDDSTARGVRMCLLARPSHLTIIDSLS